jgi:glucose-1-phosphate thymidylyltransferase
VAGKPIISYIIDELLAVGIDDFIFVVGYLGDKIKTYLQNEYPTLQKTFIYQEERDGLGHAVWMARHELPREEPIFIVLGDTIFDADLNQFLNTPNSCLGIKTVDDPRDFGVVELDDSFRVKRAIEKPKIPRSNQAIVGLYKINETGALIDALAYNIENNVRTRGEFHLTDGIMRMIDQNIFFSAIPVDNWFDCGRKDILLETNAMLLRKEGFASPLSLQFPNTIIIPPVHIRADCKIENSIIGPNVTIGEGSSIQYAVVRESIIGSFAIIENVVLYKSVVGSDTMVRGMQQSLNIGDNTEIDWG